MSATSYIRRIAANLAAEAKARVSDLHDELKEMERRKIEIEAELNTARLSDKRLAHFQVAVRGTHQCPRCGIDRGIQSNLLTVAHGVDATNSFGKLFRCGVCEYEIVVPR